MEKMIIKMTTNQINTSKSNNILIDVIINDPESKMRVKNKEIDEMVTEESKKRRFNAPLTIEEKVLLNVG